MIVVLDNRAQEKKTAASRSVLLGSVLAVISGGASQALAHSETGTQLETVEVVGERLRSENDNAITGKIDLEDIRERQPVSLSDLFVANPEISVGGGTVNAQRLYLRGVESSNLNITIDGIRQGRNLFQHRGGMLRLEPHLLKEVEVSVGPGSADQGAGALGGAVTFTTVDAQDLLSESQYFGSTIKAGYMSVNDASQLGVTGYGRIGDNAGLVVHASGLDSDNMERGGGDEIPNSADKDSSFFIKYSLLNAGDHSLRVSAERNKNEGLYPWGAGDYPPDVYLAFYAQGFAGGSAAKQLLERNAYAINYSWTPDSALINTTLNLFKSENSLENLNTGEQHDSDVTGWDLKNTSRFEGMGIEHILVAGVDFFEDEGTNFTQQITYTNDNENLGFYIQERMAGEKWTFSAGARYDSYDSEYGPRTSSDSTWSPNISGTFNLTEQLTVLAGYSQASRGTGIMPLSGLDHIVDNVNFRGGKLDPETSESKNLGLRYRQDGLFGLDGQLEARLSYFDTELEDIISFVGGARMRPITEFYNIDGAYSSEGYELELSWTGKKLASKMRFSHTDLTDPNGDDIGEVLRLGVATGDKLVWDNSYDILPNLQAGYTLTSVSELDDLPQGVTSKDGYVTHDLRLRWRPEQVKGLTLYLMAQNLTDKKYTDHTTFTFGNTEGLEEPGRDIRLIAQMTF